MESLEEVLSSYCSKMKASVASLQQIREAVKSIARQKAAAAAAANAAAAPAADAGAAAGGAAAAAADAAEPAEASAEMPPLEAAQLHVTTAFAACTLWFAYLKTQGLSTQTHPVSKDLISVLLAGARPAVHAEDERRPTTVDAAAAGRFIAHYTATVGRRKAFNSADLEEGIPQGPPKKRCRRRGPRGPPQLHSNRQACSNADSQQQEVQQANDGTTKSLANNGSSNSGSNGSSNSGSNGSSNSHSNSSNVKPTMRKSKKAKQRP
ncbi:hypothetical protein Efla_005713 [Eimeria flavescens]